MRRPVDRLVGLVFLLALVLPACASSAAPRTFIYYRCFSSDPGAMRNGPAQ
jgi:hypothetical protein